MSPGHLYIVEPTRDGELYPPPYGEYEQGERGKEGQWQVGQALEKTRSMIRFEPHSAQDFIDAVDRLYPDVEAFAPSNDRIETNRKRLKEHLQDDWLIVSARESDEETGSTDDWKSRDIPPQVTVLTQRPDRFESYADYRTFEQECGVSVPKYQVSIGQRLGRLPNEKCTFDVADEAETAWYSPVYSRAEGLILDQERERPQSDVCL
jgi:CRISPR-associated endonuclease/helicase Cas3